MHKADLASWSGIIAKQMVQEGFAKDIKEGKKIVAILQNLAGTHLLCSECKKVYPDTYFYKNRSGVSRRDRATFCKGCYKAKYKPVCTATVQNP